MYHENVIKNCEIIITHSHQPTAAQTVADTHPMGMSDQMDIESILDRNTNDSLVPTKFKSDQVTRGMTVGITMGATVDTSDPEIRVPPNPSAPETSPATNIQAVTPSPRASPSKKKRAESSGSKLSKVLSSMSLQSIEYFNNLSYTSGQDFDAGFREFLDAITATLIESL